MHCSSHLLVIPQRRIAFDISNRSDCFVIRSGAMQLLVIP
jgi:hypothetical protein